MFYLQWRNNMTNISKIRIAVISLLHIVCMFAISLINVFLVNKDTPIELTSLYMTLYFVIFPCICGATLKIFVNNIKIALIITTVCLIIWSAGDAMLRQSRFFAELLINAIVFPIIFLAYFITFSILKKEKKKASIAFAILYALIFSFIFWCGNYFIMSFAK